MRGELVPVVGTDRCRAGLGVDREKVAVAWPPASSGSGWAAAVARVGWLHRKGGATAGPGQRG
jgi:hypothetical protein